MAYRHFLKTMVCFGLAAVIFGGGILSAADTQPAQHAKPHGKATKEPQPAETAVLSPETVVRADVPYGKDEKQRLDVYSPRARRARRSSYSSIAASGPKATRAR